MDEYEKKLFDALTAKVDALVAAIPVPEQKEDVDPKIVKAETALRASMKGFLPQEKLDALSFDDLIAIAAIKEDIIAQPQFMAPPTGDSKEDTIDIIPDQMKAHKADGSVI